LREELNSLLLLYSCFSHILSRKPIGSLAEVDAVIAFQHDKHVVS